MLVLPSRQRWIVAVMMIASVLAIVGVRPGQAHAANAASARLISDELVTNLSCADLSPAAIYKSIDPWALDRNDRMVDTYNFNANALGHCWAIARFQRLAILLGRMSIAHDSREIDRLARGADYVSILSTPLYLRQPINRLKVFGMPADKERYSTRFDDSLHRGTNQKPDSQSFFKALEDAQKRLFYSTSNFSLIGPLASQASQRAEFANIVSLTKKKMLPLINLRFTRLAQHVVVVMSAKLLRPGFWRLTTVDANGGAYERRELNVIADKGLIKMCYGHLSSESETDYCPSMTHEVVKSTVLVGEDERPMIEQALVIHYRAQCSR